MGRYIAYRTKGLEITPRLVYLPSEVNIVLELLQIDWKVIVEGKTHILKLLTEFNESRIRVSSHFIAYETSTKIDTPF